MKKTIKLAGISILLILMLGVLVGCGNSNTIVATAEGDWLGDNFTETFEIRFDGDEIESATMTYEFENEEGAENYYEFWNSLMEMVHLEHTHTRSGRTVVREFTAEGVMEWLELEEGATRADIETVLEEEGYTI